MTKPVLLAGLVGGVVGAIVCFALLRTFTPVAKSASQTSTISQASPEARVFADDIVAKLKADKDDEVVGLMRLAFLEMTDQQFDEVRNSFLATRASTPYGRSLGIDFAREYAINKDLARFVYLERFADGCVAWIITCYNGAKGWQLVGLRHMKVDAAFETLK